LPIFHLDLDTCPAAPLNQSYETAARQDLASVSCYCLLMIDKTLLQLIAAKKGELE
jgi:hypothetical protein